MLSKITEKAKQLPKLVSSEKSEELENYLVGLDIGTEYVKALVARVVGDSAEVIGVGRAHQDLSDMHAGAISDIAGVVQNCDRALSEAEQQAGVSVRTAIIGIAGELVKGTTTTTKVTRKDASKELDIEEMQRIITLVQQRAEEKAKASLAWELGGKEVEVRLVNSALVRIDIDGYKVNNPVGFQGKEVMIELYTAFAPMIHIGALERTANELDLELLAVAAEPFAVARSVVGNDQNSSLSAILMDIGGGTTDIAVLNEGGVEGTKMFGIGGRAFTKSIERELDVDFDQAEVLKLNLKSDNAPTQQIPRIEAALHKTIKVWSSGVELALGEFSKLDHLPNRVLLCGGGSSLDLLIKTLEESAWHKELPFTKKPTIHHIQPDEIVGITDTTGTISDHTYTTAMGLLRVGIDTLDQEVASSQKAESQIKDKFNKILST